LLRRLGLRLGIVVVFLAVTVVVTGVLAVDRAPAIGEALTVSPQDVGRVHALLKRYAPTRNQPGVVRTAWLGERDLELVLAEGGRRAVGELRPRVRLFARRAWLQLSVPLPEGPWRVFGNWLNIEAVLEQRPGLPEVSQLRVGDLRLPAALAVFAVKSGLKGRALEAPVQLAAQAVNRVSFLPRMSVVAFAWPDTNLRQALADTLLSPEDQARVRIHAERLSTVRAALGPGRPKLTLSQMLPPLVSLARDRLREGGVAVGTPSEELRAAMLALALRAMPQVANKLLPTSRQWDAMLPFALTLRGRQDFPLHFLVSAIIAAEGNGPMADAVGIYKEIADSRGGSGFSFNDIAADRAGTRFGLLAVNAPEVLLDRLSQPIADGDLLPPVDDLPEFLTAAQFRQRYGDVESPVYREQAQDIEQRLDRLPLLAPA
jgi:hypothetical protein